MLDQQDVSLSLALNTFNIILVIVCKATCQRNIYFKDQFVIILIYILPDYCTSFDLPLESFFSRDGSQIVRPVLMQKQKLDCLDLKLRLTLLCV